MAGKTDNFSGSWYQSPIIFSKLAQAAHVDASDVLIFYAPEKMIIDKVVAVTSTAYSAGDAADQVDVVVNVAGSEALRLNSTKGDLAAAGAVASQAGPYSVAAGGEGDGGVDVTDADVNLASGKLDIYLYLRLDPS